MALFYIISLEKEFKSIKLILTPQPEGGYTVTSPTLPELITEGDTIDEALENASGAFVAVVELYEELGKPRPSNAQIPNANRPISLENVYPIT